MKAAATAVPAGFVRVDMSDMDHMGMWSRQGAGFVDYWTPSSPKVVRREAPLGVSGRRITTVRLRQRSERVSA